MVDGKNYELPEYLQDKQPPSGNLEWLTTSVDERDRNKKIREKQFVKTIRDEMTREDAQYLAIAAAFGEIRLPDVMIPNLTKENVENFWTFSNDKKIIALYTLECCSLYYGVLAEEINIKSGKKFVEKIRDLFKDSKAIEKGMFSYNFSYVIAAESKQRQKSIPSELVEILDYPLLLDQQFNTFFTRLDNQQKGK